MNDILDHTTRSGETTASGAASSSSITKAITAFNELSGYVLFFMMLMITVDVTGRYLFASPIPGTLEFTEFLMVFVVFLSLPYVQLKKRHICVELVTQRLPEKVADVFAIVTLLIAAVFFILMAWQSWLSATSSLEYREASEGLIQIPIYPPKFAIPFGSAIMALQLLRDMGDRFRHLVSAE